jgi:hypothetical protein
MPPPASQDGVVLVEGGGMMSGLMDKAKGMVAGKDKGGGAGGPGMMSGLMDKAKEGMVSATASGGKDKGGGAGGLMDKVGGMMSSIPGMGGGEKGEGGGGGGGGGENSERWGVVECLKWVKEKVVDLVMLIKDFMMFLPVMKEIAIAAIILGAIALLVLLVIYLVYVINPRIPQINHSEDLEGTMERYVSDLVAAFQTISEGDNAWLMSSSLPGFSGPTSTLMSNVATVLGRADVPVDLQTYFEFRKPLLHYGWLSRSDLRNNAPQFVQADGETLDTSDFRDNVLEPMEAIASAVSDLSESLRGAGDMRLVLEAAGMDAWNADKVAVATAVHSVRMMLDPEKIEAINRMWSTRRKHLPMAIWTVYYLPLVDSIYKVRIPSFWEKFPKTYVQFLQDAMDWWGGVGLWIDQIPCRLAYSDPADRMAKCAGGADSFFAPAKVDADGNPRKPDIEEQFGLADIGRALSSIGNFFINIGQMGEALGNLFTQFPQDPFGSIVGLLSIFLGLIFGLIFLYFYLTLTVTGVFFGFVFITCTIYAVLFCVLYTIYLVLLSVLMAIPYFGLWLLDMPTGGFVARMMRCEERLDAWYNQPGFSDDNGFEHMFPFCVRPCPERYRPALGGTCCFSRAPYMPDYCPQQQVYRILRAGSKPWTSGPLSLVRFKPPPGFGWMAYPAKRALLLKAYEQKVKWYQGCYASLTKYDYLTRHLCDNFDLLGPAVDADGQLVMAAICKDCFCDYRSDDLRTGIMASMTSYGYQEDAPPPAGQPSSVPDPSDPTGGARVPAGNLSQCARLHAAVANSLAAGLASGSGGPGSELFRRTMLLAVLVVCVLLSLYSLLDRG